MSTAAARAAMERRTQCEDMNGSWRMEDEYSGFYSLASHPLLFILV